MNTEIFDYLKALSKKDFFVINAINCVLSAVIIISALISLTRGSNMVLYTIMFLAATGLLAINSYKCFKRKSKNGWVFAILGVIFLGLSGMAIYALIIQ